MARALAAGGRDYCRHVAGRAAEVHAWRHDRADQAGIRLVGTQITSGPALVSLMGLLFATLAGYAIDRLGAWRAGLMVVTFSAGGLAPIAASYIFDVTRSCDMVIRAVIPSFVIAALMFVLLGAAPEFSRGDGSG